MTLFLFDLPVAGIGFALEEANTAGKVIVLLLFIGSVFAWSIMLAKIWQLRQARRVSRNFLAAYRKEEHSASLFLKKQKFDASPLYVMYDKTCIALGTALESRGSAQDNLFTGRAGSPLKTLEDIHVRAIRSVVERVMANQALLLENGMGLLATAVTTAPFLGLLGTVWGVMDAFGGMAITGSAMLSAVAPGISGALLTTVVGLLVALPSAIGYNVLSDYIRRLCVEMENFSQELMTDIEREYL